MIWIWFSFVLSRVRERCCGLQLSVLCAISRPAIVLIWVWVFSCCLESDDRCGLHLRVLCVYNPTTVVIWIWESSMLSRVLRPIRYGYECPLCCLESDDLRDMDRSVVCSLEYDDLCDMDLSVLSAVSFSTNFVVWIWVSCAVSSTTTVVIWVWVSSVLSRIWRALLSGSEWFLCFLDYCFLDLSIL